MPTTATAKMMLRFQKLQELAIKAYEGHILHKRDDTTGRWCLARCYEDGSPRSDMFTEIISLAGGRLFVGGDIDDVVFAYYSSNIEQGTPEWHQAKLRWIGRCLDVGYYVRQKAAIGMTGGGSLTTTWGEDIARAVIDDEIAVCANAEHIEKLEELKTHCEDGPEWYRMHLHSNFNYDEAEGLAGAGDVIAPRVVFAWAAARRLCGLLE